MCGKEEYRMEVYRVHEVSIELLVIAAVFVTCLLIDKFIVQKIKKERDDNIV